MRLGVVASAKCTLAPKGHLNLGAYSVYASTELAKENIYLFLAQVPDRILQAITNHYTQIKFNVNTFTKKVHFYNTFMLNNRVE